MYIIVVVVDQVLISYTRKSMYYFDFNIICLHNAIPFVYLEYEKMLLLDGIFYIQIFVCVCICFLFLFYLLIYFSVSFSRMFMRLFFFFFLCSTWEARPCIQCSCSEYIARGGSSGDGAAGCQGGD